MSRPVWARKRPLTVEAIQHTDSAYVDRVVNWLLSHRQAAYGIHNSGELIIVTTSHGRRRVAVGDWVIARGQGDFEVLPARVFHEQYDVVGTDE